MRHLRLLLAVFVGASVAGCGTSDSSSSNGTGDVTATLKASPFALEPGIEAYRCQSFANPFGRDVELSQIQSAMTEHSHHLLVFLVDNAMDGELETCSGTELLGWPLYGSQLPSDDLTLPEGVTLQLKRTQGLVMQAHYLNASQDYLSINVSLTLTAIPNQDSHVHASTYLGNITQINVPAHSTATVNGTCPVKSGTNILQGTGHMHAHGTRFQALTNGQMLLDFKTWDNPEPVKFNPVVQIADGAVHYSCTYDNLSDAPLLFGASARDQEMCVLGLVIYPELSSHDIVDCTM